MVLSTNEIAAPRLPRRLIPNLVDHQTNSRIPHADPMALALAQSMTQGLPLTSHSYFMPNPSVDSTAWSSSFVSPESLALSSVPISSSAASAFRRPSLPRRPISSQPQKSHQQRTESKATPPSHLYASPALSSASSLGHLAMSQNSGTLSSAPSTETLFSPYTPSMASGTSMMIPQFSPPMTPFEPIQSPVSEPDVVKGTSSPVSLLDINNIHLNTQLNEPLVLKSFNRVVWEDQGVCVYELVIGSHTLCRRADNNMINGTKLLNMTSVSRGMRDGILKKEPVRQVIRIGPVSLKGVWLPFQRCMELAQTHGIYDSIEPIFSNDPLEMIRKLNLISESAKPTCLLPNPLPPPFFDFPAARKPPKAPRSNRGKISKAKGPYQLPPRTFPSQPGPLFDPSLLSFGNPLALSLPMSSNGSFALDHQLPIHQALASTNPLQLSQLTGMPLHHPPSRMRAENVDNFINECSWALGAPMSVLDPYTNPSLLSLQQQQQSAAHTSPMSSRKSATVPAFMQHESVRPSMNSNGPAYSSSDIIEAIQSSDKFINFGE